MKSKVTYEATGTQKVFSFGFDYLRTSFVKASLNGVECFVYGKDYTVNNKEIAFTVAPNGTLCIFRETPTDRLVTWQEGSVIKATDMSIQQVQTLHVLEETVDNIYTTTLSLGTSGQWNAQKKRIENLGTPVADTDAVTVAFLKTYASLGDTGLDPEDIQKLLSGVVINEENIAALELELQRVAETIPTKLSQLTNDDSTVKDATYTHTDNNFDDQLKQRLETLKEIKKIEFTSDSAEWSNSSPYSYTKQLTEDNTLLALFKKDGTVYKVDATTNAYVTLDNKLVMDGVTQKFSGYLLVTGTVAYGDINELLALILNEETDHTYTLEEIIGAPYATPVYPDAEQLANSISQINTLANTMNTNINNVLTQALAAKGDCMDMWQAFSDSLGSVTLSDLASKTELNTAIEAVNSNLTTNYAPITALSAYMPKANFVSVTVLPDAPASDVWYFIQE